MIERYQHAHVGVLMGGLSSEREVSLASGNAVYEALRGLGYRCSAIDWQRGHVLPALLADVDVVWNALHGTLGEDGAVQGLCECLGLPYTGSKVLASSLAMDKRMSKIVFEAHGIDTPAWAMADGDELPATLALPVVVKPVADGSSVGVALVREGQDLAPALATARATGAVLVEELITGAELSIGILGDEVIGTVEIRPAEGFYDYEAKYIRDDTQYIVPAPLPSPVEARVIAVAKAAHDALGCSGYSRVDVLVTPAGRATVIEVNTLPGMTSHSLLPKIAAHRGIDFAHLCERILELT